MIHNLEFRNSLTHPWVILKWYNQQIFCEQTFFSEQNVLVYDLLPTHSNIAEKQINWPEISVEKMHKKD